MRGISKSHRTLRPLLTVFKTVPLPLGLLIHWRRDWDSNPERISPHGLASRSNDHYRISPRVIVLKFWRRGHVPTVHGCYPTSFPARSVCQFQHLSNWRRGRVLKPHGSLRTLLDAFEASALPLGLPLRKWHVTIDSNYYKWFWRPLCYR